MIELFRFVGGMLVVCGSLCVLISAVGVLRFPDLFTRLHAGSVATTLGSACVLFGLTPYSGLDVATFKMALIQLFLLITGAASTHALARAALLAGIRPDTGPGTKSVEDNK